MDCVEFWMGHVTDPNRYDKFYRDREYNLGQHRIAEKHLNILSHREPGRFDVKAMRKEDLFELAQELREYGPVIGKE